MTVIIRRAGSDTSIDDIVAANQLQTTPPSATTVVRPADQHHPRTPTTTTTTTTSAPNYPAVPFAVHSRSNDHLNSRHRPLPRSRPHSPHRPSVPHTTIPSYDCVEARLDIGSSQSDEYASDHCRGEDFYYAGRDDDADDGCYDSEEGEQREMSGSGGGGGGGGGGFYDSTGDTYDECIAHTDDSRVGGGYAYEDADYHGDDRGGGFSCGGVGGVSGRDGVDGVNGERAIIVRSTRMPRYAGGESEIYVGTRSDNYALDADGFDDNKHPGNVPFFV